MDTTTAAAPPRTRGAYRIVEGPEGIDLDATHAMLASTSWAEGIPRELVARGFANSLAFGLWHGDAGAGGTRGVQVGVARVITDRATYAYLCDVFVHEAHRGQGLGKWLMDVVMAHPDLQGLRRFGLVTRDMHPLYEQVGFTALAHPERHMEISRPGLYRQGGA